MSQIAITSKSHDLEAGNFLSRSTGAYLVLEVFQTRVVHFCFCLVHITCLCLCALNMSDVEGGQAGHMKAVIAAHVRVVANLATLT